VKNKLRFTCKFFLGYADKFPGFFDYKSSQNFFSHSSHNSFGTTKHRSFIKYVLWLWPKVTIHFFYKHMKLLDQARIYIALPIYDIEPQIMLRGLPLRTSAQNLEKFTSSPLVRTGSTLLPLVRADTS